MTNSKCLLTLAVIVALVSALAYSDADAAKTNASATTAHPGHKASTTAKSETEADATTHHGGKTTAKPHDVTTTTKHVAAKTTTKHAANTTVKPHDGSTTTKHATAKATSKPGSASTTSQPAQPAHSTQSSHPTHPSHPSHPSHSSSKPKAVAGTTAKAPASSSNTTTTASGGDPDEQVIKKLTEDKMKEAELLDKIFTAFSDWETWLNVHKKMSLNRFKMYHLSRVMKRISKDIIAQPYQVYKRKQVESTTEII